MKKLMLSLVTAGLAVSSLGAYAAFPTGAAPFQVVVPNLKSGVEVILEGLYLQPTNSNLVYSTASATVGNKTNVNTSSVKPDYGFGFRAGLGYVFPNSGNDVQLIWTHFDHSTSASTSFPYPQAPATFLQTSGSDVSFKYDAVDLDVGQYTDIGTRLQTRLFAGVRGVQLKNDETLSQVVANNQLTTLSAAGVFNSKFTGIGPRLGVETSYHLGHCFGLGAHLATALLVGQVETGANGTVVSNNGSVTTTQTASATTDNQIRVVPALDAKIGVNYTVLFKNNASSMTIEAGYQATQYFDAIDRVHIASVTSLSNPTITTSGIGFNGPYLSLDFKM